MWFQCADSNGFPAALPNILRNTRIPTHSSIGNGKETPPLAAAG
jgi:hypothetical protein